MTQAPTVTVRYWAAARAAAGVDAETYAGSSVDAVLAQAVSAHPGLERVVAASSFLVDGRSAARTDPLPAGATVEVLPPFAGG